MPIDPNIALQGRPVAPPENLLDAYGKVAQLRSLINQQKMAPELLKSAQLENQQKTLQLGGMQAQNDAWRNALKIGEDGTPTIDKDAVTKTLADKGYGSLVPGVIKSFSDMEEAAGKVREQKSKLSNEELDYAGNVGAAAKAANYDPDILKIGLTHAAAIYGPQSPSAQALQAIQADPSKAQQVADHLISQSPKQKTLANETTTADARKATADIAAKKLPGELTEQGLRTTQLQQQTTGTQPISPEAQARLDVEKKNAARAAAAQTETARHNTVEERQGTARIANEQQGLRIRKVEADPFGQFGLNDKPIGGGVAGAGGALQTGEDYLRTLPQGMAAQVKAIAEGRQNPPPRASSGVALQIMNAVNQYDPQFSLQKAQIRKAFTTGNDGRNIGALNTAAVHLDQLAEVADGLANGSFRPGNQLFNAFKNMFGNSAPTNFEGIKAAVSSEMASALKGNATDQEIASIKSTIDKSASPEQLAGSVKTNLDILGAKLNTYKERYNQQIPNDTNWSPVMPTAKAVFDKHGINPTAGPASVKPAAGAAQRPTASDGKGNTVEWDGTAWVPQRK
jgi:hypothetical protein